MHSLSSDRFPAAEPSANFGRLQSPTLNALIANTKDALLAEFRQSLQAQEHLLRLALNEAEAIAWQTSYPHLVFPTLAAEKAQAVAAWNARQRSLRPTDSELSFAA